MRLPNLARDAVHVGRAGHALEREERHLCVVGDDQRPGGGPELDAGGSVSALDLRPAVELNPVAERVTDGAAEQAGQTVVDGWLEQSHVGCVAAFIVVSCSRRR
jgi:hypothetical protein